MRLTLRTLLAWLDDTLPPSEVREIGKQVSESSFAQELVERIHRVCRQRRLTVPSRKGPEGTDPNVVAGYVDNDLDPEQVTEYEKKCLTSDVNLAEAACVHQILSLLGQKVHVPHEAKARMYQLVKGRESMPPPKADGARPRPPEPVTKPIQPWVAPEPPPRPFLERFGPALACLALIGILSWSAYQSLTPPAQDAPLPTVATPGPGPLAKAEAGRGPEAVVEPAEPTPAGPGSTSPLEPSGPGPAAKTPDREPVADAARKSQDTATKSQEATKARSVPAGAIGVVDRVGGVLLRFNSESREWEKIAEGTPLGTGDQLIALAPFRAQIVLASQPLRLIGETQLRLLSKTSADTPAFELVHGRVVLAGAEGAKPARVDFAGKTLTLERGPQQAVGLEHAARWKYGAEVSRPASLAIHSESGDLKVTMGGTEQKLAGPGTILAEPGGRLQAGDGTAVPDWMTPEASEKEQKLAEGFAALFSADGHVLADIVSATENESPVNKNYAIHAVKALGDLTFLVPILSRAKDPAAREGAAAALREFLAQGPESLRRIEEPLAEEFGEAPARVIRKLLVGYTAEEAAKRDTLERLLEDASPDEPSLVVRELALENLERITGKGDQGYDPEDPDEEAFAALKAQLNRAESKPAARRKTAE